MNVRLLLALCTLFAMTGCVRFVPANPAFALTPEEAHCELDEMKEDKAPLQRHVIVLAGYGDPGLVSAEIAQRIKARTTQPELVTSVAYFFEPSIEAARETTIRHALRRFADGDEEALASMEFDLVGFSMGGLVSRLVAADVEHGQPPLNVRRIFTIGTPHLGAKASDLPSFDRKVTAMRRGSDFLERLDDYREEADYELICYVRIGDGIVGHENASPEGHPVLWVPNEAYEFAHLSAGSDPRLLADIIRRLRGEEAYSDLASAPLPELE